MEDKINKRVKSLNNVLVEDIDILRNILNKDNEIVLQEENITAMKNLTEEMRTILYTIHILENKLLYKGE